MEKITATFCVLTVIGALLVVSQAGDLGNSTTSSTVPKTTEKTSNNTEHSILHTTEISTITTSTSSNSHVQKEDGSTSGPEDDVSSSTMYPATNNSQGTTTERPKTASTPGASTLGKVKNQTASTKHPTTKPTTQGTITKSTPVGGKSDKNTHQGSPASYIIIIIIVIILCVIGGIAFYCVQNKTRRFSLDQHSKNEDAHIPLSAVEPEVFEASSAKDMQTFTAAETAGSGEGASPADSVEKKDKEKAPTEADQQEKDSSADSQDTVPLAEKPGELTVVDLNDGEPAISNKTSVESLDEPLNENNSNNRARANGYGSCGKFTEICLDDLP